MRKLSVLPFIMMVCFLSVSCSTDYEQESKSDISPTMTGKEALEQITEIANDYGVKIIVKPTDPNATWTKDNLRQIESLIKGIAQLKGTYRLQLSKNDANKMIFKQIKKTSRKKKLTLEQEMSDEDTKSYAWEPKTSDFVYAGGYTFECTFSALWTSNKYGWANWAEVGGSINRVFETTEEENIIEEGTTHEQCSWRPQGGDAIAFEGSASYYVKIDLSDEKPFQNAYVEITLSYNGECSVMTDKDGNSTACGAVTWLESL